MAPPRKKNNGNRKTTFKTRFKRNPIGTMKTEFNKLGKAKYPVALIGMGIVTAPLADEIVAAGSRISPSLGSLMSVFTNYGKTISQRMKGT